MEDIGGSCASESTKPVRFTVGWRSPGISFPLTQTMTNVEVSEDLMSLDADDDKRPGVRGFNFP